MSDISQEVRDALRQRLAAHDPELLEPLTRDVVRSFEKVLAEERRRIARDLHDRVGHGMALVAQNLELHREYAGRDAERAQTKLAAAVAALGDALRIVRQVATELRFSAGTSGLHQALRAYLRSTAPATVRTRLRVTGDLAALPPDVGDELYLIVREAAWNALRHAEPTELRVTVAVTGTAVTASVTDNGRGFAPHEPARPRAGGLLCMRERARLLNGSLEVSGGIGKGTTVAVQAPLNGGRR